jgi:hypothetical protein
MKRRALGVIFAALIAAGVLSPAAVAAGSKTETTTSH